MRLKARSTVLFPQPEGPMMADAFYGQEIAIVDVQVLGFNGVTTIFRD